MGNIINNAENNKIDPVSCFIAAKNKLMAQPSSNNIAIRLECFVLRKSLTTLLMSYFMLKLYSYLQRQSIYFLGWTKLASIKSPPSYFNSTRIFLTLHASKNQTNSSLLQANKFNLTSVFMLFASHLFNYFLHFFAE